MKLINLLIFMSLLALVACSGVPRAVAPTVEPTRPPASVATIAPAQPAATPTSAAATKPTDAPVSSQANTTTGKLGQEIALKVGETVMIEGEGVTLEMAEVTEDSRCPQGVTCVWAGRLVVTARLGKAGAKGEEMSLSTQTKDAATKTVNGYSVTLVKVDPVKTVQTTDPSQYRLTFVVTKG